MVACLTETKPEQNEEYIELFREQLKKRTLSSEWMLFAISDFCNRLEQSSNYECYREICDLIFQQKYNIDYKIGYALLQTNMQMLKLNVKKVEMWAERGILMCVQWGHSQRILDFLYQKAECHMFLQEKEKEIADIAYKDPITGVYNRNYFEYEKDRIDLKKMYALLSVSINHAEYFKRKYEVFFMESILRKGVSILQECTSEKIRICRVSENVFYFWFMEPVQLETYIHDIKTTFEQEGEKVNIPYSFSVGAIYNNTVGKESIDELINRCGKMRLLDEKHAEAKFVEGKMKLL